MIVKVGTEITDEAQIAYLESSARIRGISVATLVRRILTTVIKDQMVLSILDDEVTAKELAPVPAPAKKYRRSKYNQTISIKRSVPMTRSQMEAQLQQAVLNTGGELVK